MEIHFEIEKTDNPLHIKASGKLQVDVVLQHSTISISLKMSRP
jgi:hypothetical protein